MTRGAQNSKGLRKYCILRSVERKNTRPPLTTRFGAPLFIYCNFGIWWSHLGAEYNAIINKMFKFH